jgi:hypothetical protein
MTFSLSLHYEVVIIFKWISDMSEHWGVSHELPVLVVSRLLLLRWIIDLDLQIHHSVGQVL